MVDEAGRGIDIGGRCSGQYVAIGFIRPANPKITQEFSTINQRKTRGTWDNLKQ